MSAPWMSETHINESKGHILGDQEPYETHFETDEIGRVFRHCQEEYGRCMSSVYIDTESGRKHVGWVFSKRRQYEDWTLRSRGERYYVHEVWVSLHVAPPTRTVEYHYREVA